MAGAASTQNLDVILRPQVDETALSRATQRLSNISQGSLNALGGINSVRAAQRGYQAQRLAERSIQEAQAASRRLYDFAGNPFLVVSNLTSSISGIKQIRQGLEQAADMIRVGTKDAAHFRKMLQELTDAGISKTSPMYKEINKQLREANKLRRDGITLETQMSAKTKGAGFVGRAIADFGLQQLATGAMFSFAFQGAAMAMQKMAEVAVNSFERIVAPSKEASENFNALAESVKRAGGKENLQFLGKALLDIADAAEKAAASKPALDAIATALNAAATQAITGLNPEQAAREAGRSGAITTALDQFLVFNVGDFWKHWDSSRFTEKNIESVLNLWGTASREAFEKTIAKQYNLEQFKRQLKAGTLTPEQKFTVYDALEAAAGAAYDNFAAAGQKMQSGASRFALIVENVSKSLDKFATMRTGVMQKFDLGFRLASLTGNASDLMAAFGKGGPQLQLGAGGRLPPIGSAAADFNAFIREYGQINNDLLTAQTALNEKQIAATNAGIAAQYEQIKMQRAQIRAGVSKAMIGRVGMTGFELAAQIAEAREQARIARLQLRAQEKQLGMQASIARASQRVAELNSRKEQLTLRQEAADAQRLQDAEAYAKAVAKAFTGNDKGEPIADVIGRKTAEYMAQ